MSWVGMGLSEEILYCCCNIREQYHQTQAGYDDDYGVITMIYDCDTRQVFSATNMTQYQG